MAIHIGKPYRIMAPLRPVSPLAGSELIEQSIRENTGAKKRNSVYYKLIERSDSTNPKFKIQNPKFRSMALWELKQSNSLNRIQHASLNELCHYEVIATISAGVLSAMPSFASVVPVET